MDDDSHAFTTIVEEEAAACEPSYYAGMAEKRLAYRHHRHEGPSLMVS